MVFLKVFLQLLYTSHFLQQFDKLTDNNSFENAFWHTPILFMLLQKNIIKAWIFFKGYSKQFRSSVSLCIQATSDFKQLSKKALMSYLCFILVFLLFYFGLYPQDIEMLGWCPAGPVLPHGKKVPLQPWLATLLVMVSQ